ncbi:MAG: hypothetical protein NVS9B12_14250 [Vulcanimicrobiaceae bacterium]
MFEDDGTALVIVPEYQLSLAIGREGQNVRLAARMTGWRLDIAAEEEADAARERYFAEREGRAAGEAAGETPEELDEEVETDAVPVAAAGIDEDLIRKLEEFKRERLGG